MRKTISMMAATTSTTAASSNVIARIVPFAGPLGVFLLGTLIIGEYYNTFLLNHHNGNDDNDDSTTTATAAAGVAKQSIQLKKTVLSSSSSSLPVSTPMNTTESDAVAETAENTGNEEEENESSSADHVSTLNNNNNNIVIDMLSIGSVVRPEYQDAQYNTFVSHISVRTFYKFNEYNDTETTCNDQLSNDDAIAIAKFCKLQSKGYEYVDNELNEWYISPGLLRAKSNPAGWICAQKRPIDAIMSVLNDYRKLAKDKHMNLVDILPDYLFLMDDDTYYNMNNVVPYITEYYEPTTSYVIAGCLIRQLNRTFTSSYGGWGTIFTKQALRYLLKPIYCNSDEVSEQQDQFTSNVCTKLNQNRIGEKPLFVDGMSVADLMEKYTFDQPIVDYQNWNDVGYCMHSDVTIGYFLNDYNIPFHSNTEHIPNHNNYIIDYDRMIPYRVESIHWRDHGYKPEKTPHDINECNNAYDRCTINSHVCHYITPNDMYYLHEEILHRVVSVTEYKSTFHDRTTVLSKEQSDNNND